ncbi:maestro heat-like repeat family member 5 [Trachemys scripta elegans]|uniref:maestro heat-like repeat family member 5 n=1 Tax=Trachemys scripta elegans TaxID=31138 RepID=UPI001555DE67|nr:maestro heat-like repeat family member 5 [Trachemys scripta elegans]
MLSEQVKLKENLDKEELDLIGEKSEICYWTLQCLGDNIIFGKMRPNIYLSRQRPSRDVLEAICDYLQGHHQISPKHRLWIYQVLQTVIISSSHIDHSLANKFLSLASEDMTKSTEVKYLFQNGASHMLVSLWKHHSADVMAKVLEGFQEVAFPHCSVLYVMGRLAYDATVFILCLISDLESLRFSMSQCPYG